MHKNTREKSSRCNEFLGKRVSVFGSFSRNALSSDLMSEKEGLLFRMKFYFGSGNDRLITSFSS